MNSVSVNIPMYRKGFLGSIWLLWDCLVARHLGKGLLELLSDSLQLLLLAHQLVLQSVNLDTNHSNFKFTFWSAWPTINHIGQAQHESTKIYLSCQWNFKTLYPMTRWNIFYSSTLTSHLTQIEAILKFPALLYYVASIVTILCLYTPLGLISFSRWNSNLPWKQNRQHLCQDFPLHGWKYPPANTATSPRQKPGSFKRFWTDFA